MNGGGAGGRVVHHRQKGELREGPKAVRKGEGGEARNEGSKEGRMDGWMDNSRASGQRHALPYPRPLIQVHVDKPDGPLRPFLGRALGIYTAELEPDRTPRVDHHAVPVAASLGVVSPDLRRGDDPALRLDGAGAEQRLPMRRARLDGEGGGVQQHLRDAGAAVLREEGAAGARVGEGQRGLREAEVKADEASRPADRGGERGGEAGPGLDRRALAEGAVVEEVELVVGRRVVDRAVRVDPDAAVQELRGRRRGVRGGRDVDAHVDGEVVLPGLFLEAEDEG